MNNLVVSIVIPVYNVEKFLEKCLESVLQQTYKNIQIICVDDASSDASLSILYKYQKRDNRIVIISNSKNMGVAYSRNRGLFSAEGKYVYFLDSDDYIKNNAIFELYNYAEQYRTDGIYFNSELKIETEALGKYNVSYTLKNIEKKIYSGASLFEIFYKNNVYTNSVCRCFWSKNFLLDNNLIFLDGFLAEDLIFSLKAILSGKRMMFVDKSYHIYRKREGTMSTFESPLKFISIFKSYCLLLKFWYNHEFNLEINNAISNYLEMILVTAKRIYYRTSGLISSDDFENGFERHLFRVLVLQEYEKSLDNIDDNIINKVNECRYVIVYGAARYAVEVVEKLERKKIHVNALAITKMHKNAVGIKGIPVYEIKDLCSIKNESIVVLGVNKENRKDVILNLKKYGFKNYVSLD